MKACTFTLVFALLAVGVACDPSTGGEGEGEGEGPCTTSEDCTGGDVCETRTPERAEGLQCDGICAPPAALGEVCFDFGRGEACGQTSHPCASGLECAVTRQGGACVVPGELGAPCLMGPFRPASDDGCADGLACGVSPGCVDGLEDTPCDDTPRCVVENSAGAEARDCVGDVSTGLCQPVECPNGNECGDGEVCVQLQTCGSVCAPPAESGERCVAFDIEATIFPCPAFVRPCEGGLGCVDVIFFVDEGAASQCGPLAEEGESCALRTNDGCAEGLTCRDDICSQ